MNMFTADHPLTASRSYPETKRATLRSYCNAVVCIALILCPLFVALAAVGMTIQDTPDVPDPSLPDLILSIVGFIVSFPAFLFLQLDEPFGFIQKMLVYFGCAFDGIFWAFAIVTCYRLVGSRFRRRLA